MELQRTSAATANATAASLQNEVHLLRAFMTDRLGLPACTLPTAPAAAAAATTENDSNTGTSSTTVRY